MKGLSNRSTESLESWKSKVEMAKRLVELSEKLLIMSEAREAKLKEELLASQNNI